jgi:hypothetical protein
MTRRTRTPRTWVRFACPVCHHEQLIPVERADLVSRDDPMRCTHSGAWRGRPAATMVRRGEVVR